MIVVIGVALVILIALAAPISAFGGTH